MLTEDTKFQALYDHYKDTFDGIRNHIKFRDRLFALILVVVTLMLFQVFSPQESNKAISQLVSAKLGLQIAIDVSFLGSVIWFSLLSLVIRYFQTAVYIERQYDYIHQVEDSLGAHYDGKTFTREGKAYLKNYPLFSNWAWVLYTIIFPLLLLLVVSAKILNEFSRVAYVASPLFLVNGLIFVGIVISTILYLLLIHFRK